MLYTHPIIKILELLNTSPIIYLWLHLKIETQPQLAKMV